MKITFTALCNADESALRRNEEACRFLQLPEVGSSKVSDSLAVVGGGASVTRCVGELRAFDGEVWAVNGAFKWCKDRGIDATFYTVDALPIVSRMAAGARRAVLSHRCDPSTFSAVDGPIEVWSGEHLGPSSATTSTLCGVERGHKSITFYGCDSCYSTAADAPNPSPIDCKERIVVRVNGQEFLTNPGLIIQAEFLAEVIRTAPHVFKERSGGLLGALVACPEWEAVAATRSLYESLTAA